MGGRKCIYMLVRLYLNHDRCSYNSYWMQPNIFFFEKHFLVDAHPFSRLLILMFCDFRRWLSRVSKPEQAAVFMLGWRHIYIHVINSLRFTFSVTPANTLISRTEVPHVQIMLSENNRKTRHGVIFQIDVAASQRCLHNLELLDASFDQ